MKNLLWGLLAFSILAHAQGTVTDIDGNTYDYLTYGTQQWTVENAAMETYRDGTPIPQVTDATQWANLTTGAWCYYDNDPTKGKLYNWYAVAGIHDNDPNTPNKEFAPEGWKVPGWSTLDSFNTIINYLEENNFNCTGQDSNGGTPGNNKLAKAVSSTNGWFENGGLECAPAYNPSLNNSSDFNAFPAGFRAINGYDSNEGSRTFFWTTQYSLDDGRAYFIERTWDYLGSMYVGKTFGASVRFVRSSDQTPPTFSSTPADTTVPCESSTDPSVTGYAYADDFSDLNYNFWNTPANGGDGNEPSNSNSGEHHAHITKDIGVWNDHQIGTQFKHIMESSSDLGTPSGYEVLGSYGGHFYYRSLSQSGWNEAYSSAQAAGGWLSAHETQAENTAVSQLNTTAGYEGVWIGLFQDQTDSNYSEPAGAWKWIGGATVSYQDTTSNNIITRVWTATDAVGNSTTYTQTITLTPPLAPTGDAEQTFCTTSTVADLTATGDNIQWYDSVTGGNLLDSTTTLTDGQMVYASQTVNGCESTDRLEVTVSIQDITITASATEVCAGESVDLSVLSNGASANALNLSSSLGNDLVSYWPFNGNEMDESDNGSIITNNGATLTSDRNGFPNSAFAFNGSQSMTFDTSSSYANWTEGITVSVWFFLNNNYNGNPRMFYIGQTDSNNKGIHLMVQTGNIGYVVSPGGGVGGLGMWSGVNAVPTGAWHHALFRANFLTGDSALFIDGQMENSGTNTNQSLLDALNGVDYSTNPGNIGQKTGGGDKWQGKLDDIAVWKRSLSDSEILNVFNLGQPSYTWSTGDITANISVSPTETTEYWVDVTTNGVTCREYVTINVTAPAAPTGDAEQTLCDTATIADLSATGDNIQWYDAATGGNLLDSTTALTNGQMVYASQTVNGCESTDRLEVTVSIQDITITASATEVCAGESVDLSVVGSINSTAFDISNYDLVLSYNNSNYYLDQTSKGWTQSRTDALTAGGDFVVINDSNENDIINQTLSNILPSSVKIVHIGYYQDTNDPNFAEPSGGWKWVDGTTNGYEQWGQGEPNNAPGNLSPNENYAHMFTIHSPDVPSYYTAGDWNDQQDGLWDWQGVVDARGLIEVSQNNILSYLWSTGDTTANISVTPTETTEYWVDVTTNGVTCREYVTINVTAPAAPTGDAQQTFCASSTVGDLTATGDNIQWYDAATGGNLLDSSTSLIDGQIVYATQTVNGCESTDRLEVTVSIQDITITASATEVCAGESVDLTVSSGLTAGTTACTSAELPANLQTGLVGYWPFCGNANDESGNGLNGIIYLNPTLTTGIDGTVNSAYDFEWDAVTGYGTAWQRIEIPYTNQLNNSEITISAWIKPESYYWPNNSIQNSMIIGSSAACSSTNLRFSLHSDASLNFSLNNGLGINSGPNKIFLNTWQHVVVRVTGSEVELFIDGISQGAVNHSVNPNFDGCLVIGEHHQGNGHWYYFDGVIDNVGIWNRALTPSEIQQLVNSSAYTWSTGDTSANISVTPTETTEYWVDVTTNGVTCREYVTINVTAPAAPTGNSEQTFCTTSTIADLSATGENIQWYDAATGGNLLDSTTALTNGQIVYATQTVNGCESTDRLEVTVSIQDITITASATEVCAGESVDLSVVGDINSTYLWSTGESNFSGQGTLIDEYSLIANTVSQNTFSTIPGNIYRLEVSGTISLGGGAGNQRDVAYYTQSGPDGTTEGTPFDSACNLRIWTSLFCDTPGLRPSPDIYDASTHTYNYPFTANSSTLDVGFWDSPLGDNGPNVVTFKLYELSNSESTITVSPTETTEYWVDVTTNGVTCREYVTINVTAPSAPTGNPVQGGCSDFTVGSNNNAFTGENLQWYATPSGGTALPDSHLLVDGTYYYISQTVDGCESSDRFEFLYLAPEPTITIDSPVICEGDSTTVSVSSSPSQGSTTFLWNTGETSDNVTFSPTESTNYWVDQIYNSGGPENIQTVCRYFFGITVDNAPEAPVSGGDISECETVAAQSLVATASANAGESITWYDAATGGNVVADPSLNAAGTVTYYAEATNDTSGCASLNRTAVTLTITSVVAPTGDTVQSFCDNVTVSDLSASGSNIQWYDAATGGNVLDPSSALSDGQLLYASQTQNGCESITRLEVSVEIDIIPDPILITTELEFCLAREASLADLEVDEQGFALEWYNSFSGGNMLPMDTLLEDGVSYYATLYDAVSGCESLMRLEVVPSVIPCEVVIYNAISLNDNGVNDYMVIENAEYFPDNSLEVYNRDGHLLYSQTQYGIGDNLFRGIANVSGIYGSTTSGDGPRLPTGSYLYVFKYFNPYEQQQYTLKGFLTINSN